MVYRVRYFVVLGLCLGVVSVAAGCGSIKKSLSKTKPYFLAKVEVVPEELERLAPDIELGPGMPADVMVLTGERTLLDYLIRPFVESVTKSFRES